MTRARIEFEVGDRVHCPYYKTTGIIKKIAPDPNYKHGDESQNIITIRKDGTADVCVYTRVINKSANIELPFYLQMVCKRKDYTMPKPSVIITEDKFKMVRVVNLSTLAEYSFSHGTDPAYALCYADSEERGDLTQLFDLLHNGFTDWASMVEEGSRTYSKGDWCAFKPHVPDPMGVDL